MSDDTYSDSYGDEDPPIESTMVQFDLQFGQMVFSAVTGEPGIVVAWVVDASLAVTYLVDWGPQYEGQERCYRAQLLTVPEQLNSQN